MSENCRSTVGNPSPGRGEFDGTNHQRIRDRYRMVYPRIVSTDLNALRLLAGFGDDGRRTHVIAGTGLEWWMTRAWLCRQQEAPGQQIEPGPAEHLTLEQLQAIDVPFDGSLTPGQRHPGLDGGIIGP
jgi:hypothetical protein